MRWIVKRRRAQSKTGDIDLVAKASARLDIPEFRFFEIAHRCWFGNGHAYFVVERAYLAYMFACRVPIWVRYLARQVQGLGPGPVPHLENEIQHRAPAIRVGILALMLVLLALALAYIAATGGELPRECLFPPCY